jgi:hypothetical protein
MNKILNVLALALALNFLAVAGGVGWLYKSGHLDHDKMQAIKAIVFPSPTTAPSQDTNSPPGPATEPTLKLDELLAQAATRPSGEQVDLIQRKIDAQVLQLDQRERALYDLQQQIRRDQVAQAAKRVELDKEQKKLTDQEQQARKLEQDEGFQKSLALYNTMAGKQVKQIFMTLDDDTVVRYLQAMEPRDAARIAKEFKTEPEVEHLHVLLEKMRQTPAATQPTASGA